MTDHQPTRVKGHRLTLTTSAPRRGWCPDARPDPLTGLLAFPDFHADLPRFLMDALADGASVAIAIGDVDGLKEYVETTNMTDPASYGHLAGNGVMTTLGAVAGDWFRERSWPAGCVATFGGDEVIVAAQIENPARFLADVRALRDRLRAVLPVTVSFALTVVPPGRPALVDQAGPDRFTDELFAAVDRCLFAHKAARRAVGLPGGSVAVTACDQQVPSTEGSLFPLPTDADEPLHVSVLPTMVADRLALLLPCVGPNGMRGHRIRAAVNYLRPTVEVVFSVAGRAVIAAPPGGDSDAPRPVILSGVRDAAGHRVPADLEARLADAGLEWTVLPSEQRDQMLSLILESADPDIRAARITAAVTSAASAAARRGQQQ